MAISGSNDISLLQMGIGLLPVGISLFLSWKYKLGLSKSLIIGVVRGTIQLVAVGYILLWAFRQSDPWVLAALILFMVGAASESALKRLDGSEQNLLQSLILFLMTENFVAFYFPCTP